MGITINNTGGATGFGAPVTRGNTTTVQVGETTLTDVARRLGVNPKALADANQQIRDPNNLKPGQDVRLQPAGSEPPMASPIDVCHIPHIPGDTPTDPVPYPQSGDTLQKAIVLAKLKEAAKKTTKSGVAVGAEKPESVVAKPFIPGSMTMIVEHGGQVLSAPVRGASNPASNDASDTGSNSSGDG